VTLWSIKTSSIDINEYKPIIMNFQNLNRTITKPEAENIKTRNEKGPSEIQWLHTISDTALTV
jgi:hypothetical protein